MAQTGVMALRGLVLDLDLDAAFGGCGFRLRCYEGGVCRGWFQGGLCGLVGRLHEYFINMTPGLGKRV